MSLWWERRKSQSPLDQHIVFFLPFFFFTSEREGLTLEAWQKNSTWKNENTRAGSTKPRSAEDPESASGRIKPQKSGFQNRQAGLFAGPNDHYLPKITPRMFCKTDLNKLTHWPLSAHFCFASEYVKFGQPSWLTFSCLSLNTATTQTLSGMSLFKSSICLLTVLQTKFCVYCIFFLLLQIFLHVYKILAFFYTSFQILTTMFLVILTHLKDVYHVKCWWVYKEYQSNTIKQLRTVNVNRTLLYSDQWRTELSPPPCPWQKCRFFFLLAK